MIYSVTCIFLHTHNKTRQIFSLLPLIKNLFHNSMLSREYLIDQIYNDWLNSMERCSVMNGQSFLRSNAKKHRCDKKMNSTSFLHAWFVVFSLLLDSTLRCFSIPVKHLLFTSIRQVTTSFFQLCRLLVIGWMPMHYTWYVYFQLIDVL